MSKTVNSTHPSSTTYENFTNAIKKENPPITGKIASYAEELFANNKIEPSGNFSSTRIDLSKPGTEDSTQENLEEITSTITQLVDESLAWSAARKVCSAIRNLFFNSSRYSTATRLLRATHNVQAIQKKANDLINKMNKMKDRTDSDFQTKKNQLESILYTLSTLEGTTTDTKTISKEVFEKLKKNAELAINSVPAMKQEDLIKGLAAPYPSKALSAIASFSFVSSAHKDLRKLNKDRYDALIERLTKPTDDLQKEQYKAALEAVLKDFDNLDCMKQLEEKAKTDQKNALATAIASLSEPVPPGSASKPNPPLVGLHPDAKAVEPNSELSRLAKSQPINLQSTITFFSETPTPKFSFADYSNFETLINALSTKYKDDSTNKEDLKLALKLTKQGLQEAQKTNTIAITPTISMEALISDYYETAPNYKRYTKIKDNGIPFDNTSLKIDKYRIIRGDGNCYFRALTYGRLEQITKLPKEERKSAFSKLYSIFLNTTQKNPSLRTEPSCKNFLDRLQTASQGECWESPKELELNIMQNADIDLGMIQLVRYITKDYLIDHQNDKLNGISIKDSISPTYEHEYTNTNDPFMEWYCREYIMKMGVDAEGSFLYINALPKLLECNCLIIHLSDKNSERNNDAQALVTPKTLDNLIVLLNPQGHYDLGYANEESLQDAKAGRSP